MTTSPVRTQKRLAALLQVDQTTISKWYVGTTEPDLSRVAQIEDACGVPRGTILTRAGLVTLEGAVEGDPRLSPAERRGLVAAYQAALRQR